MEYNITQLLSSDFERCAELWNMKKQPELAERFYADLCSGNRLTWVCEQNGALLGEISLVFDMSDPDYTIQHPKSLCLAPDREKRLPQARDRQSAGGICHRTS